MITPIGPSRGQITNDREFRFDQGMVGGRCDFVRQHSVYFQGVFTRGVTGWFRTGLGFWARRDDSRAPLGDHRDGLKPLAGSDFGTRRIDRLPGLGHLRKACSMNAFINGIPKRKTSFD